MKNRNYKNVSNAVSAIYTDSTISSISIYTISYRKKRIKREFKSSVRVNEN